MLGVPFAAQIRFNNISAFAIFVFGRSNIARAREWMCSFFIPGCCRCSSTGFVAKTRRPAAVTLLLQSCTKENASARTLTGPLPPTGCNAC